MAELFIKNSLKQPFSQIWEPVINLKHVTQNRYENCKVPYYRFLNMEKHGIYHRFDYYDPVSFKDCGVKVEWEKYAKYTFEPSDLMKIIEFKVMKHSRQSNHIVAYLDQITVRDRILKDDVTVEIVLPNFTFAQIMEFIKIATENNCTNVTALLLNYKNEHYKDYNFMDEFTLGDL